MRSIVTGATGFIGFHLTTRLLGQGDEVHLLLRQESDVADLDPRAIVHRTKPSAAIVDLFAAIKPDVVFHLASRFQVTHEAADIDGIVSSNIGFATAVADAAVRAGCRRFVNAGTSWQHYHSDSYAPVCLYAATKQAFEAILRFFSDSAGLQVITLKLFDTYGPRDRRRKLLSTFRQVALDGGSLDMSPGDQLIDLVHIDDVVTCFLMAAARLGAAAAPGMEEYAVSSGAPIKLRTLAEVFARVARRNLDIRWGARPYRSREVMRPWSAGTPLPGWSPRVALEDGLREIMADV